MNSIFKNLECNCSFKDLFNKSQQRKCVGGGVFYLTFTMHTRKWKTIYCMYGIDYVYLPNVELLAMHA